MTEVSLVMSWLFRDRESENFVMKWIVMDRESENPHSTPKLNLPSDMSRVMQFQREQRQVILFV